MLDQQIQGGSDYERNEYGDMVGAVSVMGGMMNSKTAGEASNRLNAQSARDDQMQTRMDNISVRAGLDYAQMREEKDAKNREVFNEYKGGFMNFGRDIDGLDLSATVMDYSGIKKDDKIEATTPAPVDDFNQGDDIDSQDGAYKYANQATTPSAELLALEEGYTGILNKDPNDN